MSDARYQRSAGISISHDPVNGLQLVDCAGQARWSSDLIQEKVLLAILAYAVWPKTFEEIKEFLCTNFDYPASLIEGTIKETINADILVPAYDDCQFEYGCRDWMNNGWEDAFYFHTYSNNLEKLDYWDDPRDEKDQAMMRVYIEEEEIPSNYKRIDSSIRINLEKPVNLKKGSAFKNAIRNKDAYTSESPELTKEFFEWFVYLNYSQTYTRNMQLTGEHVAKTSPSGGSRHPTEIYPVVLDVTGLRSGVYHYNVKDHALDMIRDDGIEDFARENVLLFKNKQKTLPKVIFLMTTIFERSMYRYREGRSYRVMHFDIGHLCGTGILLSGALEKDGGSFYSMNEGKVAEFLKIDGIFESPMAYFTLG